MPDWTAIIISAKRLEKNHASNPWPTTWSKQWDFDRRWRALIQRLLAESRAKRKGDAVASPLESRLEAS